MDLVFEISFKNWVIEGLIALPYCYHANGWSLSNILKKFPNNSFKQMLEHFPDDKVYSPDIFY